MPAMFPSHWEATERVPEHFAPPGSWAKLEAKFLAVAAPSAPVLVVTKHYETTGCGGRGGYVLHSTMHLGVLPAEPPFVSSEEPDLIVGNFTIKVPRHVVWWGYDFHLKEEPIVISIVHTRQADPERPIYSPYRTLAHLERREAEVGQAPDYPVEFAVGLAAIHAHVAEHGGSADDFFLKAARMLDISAPLPPVLAEHDRKIREGIIDELLAYIEEIRRLEAKVAAIFQRVRPGGVYSPDGLGLSITVCETEDDARVITMGERMRIRDRHDDIRRALAQAIELRMHERPWVRSLPTPGMTIDVPAFIRALAGKLGVALPS